MTEKSEKVNESQIDFLKPCLCGSSVPPIVSAYRKELFVPNDWVHIKCPSCGWGTTIFATLEQAVDEWNRRVKE